MSVMKNITYNNMPFQSDTPLGDFYTYASLQELAEQSEMDKEGMFRCRAIGIMQSINGRFYLSCLEMPMSKSEPMMQLSLIYLKKPPPSTIVPYPVQVFGTLQWKNRPVIYVKVLQVFNTAMAVRLQDTMRRIANAHFAKNIDNNNEEII